MKQASPTDHRVFGFTELGQIRVSLFNGQDSHAPGAFYSWIVCATSSQLAYKLANHYEQPLTEDEFDALEELETSQADTSPYTAELEIKCDECGGSGVDPGGLNTYEPEDCPRCLGTGRETVMRNFLAEAFALASGESSRPIERQHLTALNAYSRQVVSAYAQKVAA